MTAVPDVDRVLRARELCALGGARVADAAREAKRMALEGLYLLEAGAATPPEARVEILLELGALRELLGELDAAETTYRRALALLDASPGTPGTAPLRIRACARLAQLYCLQGRFDEADAVADRRQGDSHAA